MELLYVGLFVISCILVWIVVYDMMSGKFGLKPYWICIAIIWVLCIPIRVDVSRNIEKSCPDSFELIIGVFPHCSGEVK